MSASWQRLSSIPVVLGHRGARHAHPENTLRAFRAALDEGAVGTEFDVMTSADGVAVVFHDVDLTRMTGGNDRRRVNSLRARELFDVRLNEDERIPSLAAVLDWAVGHGALLNIELKSQNPLSDAIADVVADLLDQYPGAADFALVSSFHPTLVRRFGRRRPDVKSALLVDRGHPCLVSRTWLNACRAAAVHPHAELLTSRPDLMNRASGFLINTWTVNDESAARQLRDLGVTGIITDRPRAIMDALRSG